MYVRKTALTVLLLICVVLVIGQEYNYVHYDTKDGLAGSTVYDLCQDKDGFMWFATENGLSRFDGANFKNFTVKDGLPDNEVLKLFADSKGRIWIGTFNKEVCYYYNGKIYNKTNDSLVKQLRLVNYLSAFAEDEKGTIALADLSKTFIIIEPGQQSAVKYYTFSNWVTTGPFAFCSEKKIMIGDALHNIYFYADGKFQFISSGKDNYVNGDSIISYTSCDWKTRRMLPKKPGYLSQSSYKNHLTFFSTYNGSWSADTAKNKWDVHYLPGKKITNTIVDAEKNLWFSTIGEGVYKLSSREIKTIQFPEVNGTGNSEVFSLFKYNNQVVAGLNHAKAAFLSGEKFSVVNYSGKSLDIERPQTNRLYSAKVLSDNSIIFGFDLFLIKEQSGRKIYNYVYPIKSVDEVNKDLIITGTSSYVLLMQAAGLKIIDTVWRERCTKVFYHAGKYYIGTLAGLYEVNKDKTYTFLGHLHPSLTRRIVDIKAGKDSTLWIASADQGIIGYRNNRITGVIKDSNGLSSNICKTLFLQGQYLWAGTNKGLNKINISDKTYPIIKYTVSDGLPSDIINAVYVEDSMVYIGSPAGLTVFNEQKISSYSICRLKMLDIKVAGGEFDSLHTNFSYKNNNIRFSYIGVSLKSAGDILYYYKLGGLNDSWMQTTQTILDYPSLPPGDYEFKLYAVNKFGVKSETVSVKFSIQAPFWQTGWFYGLLVLFAAALAGWIVNIRNRKYSRKLKEANALQKQFAVLEQQALQAQMNPHFIFNCLNGIQQYILTGNKEKANEYLTCFARLIRQTLDNSAKKTISVAQEIKYLTEYLEMEKMRAAGSFRYTITADNHSETENTEIPAMLLQPYIENALRHGLRYKTSGTGEVKISFVQNNGHLQCKVVDNGVGRIAASEFKSKQHIEYQSKGMSLTARRIDLLNKINDAQITVTVNDLYDYNNSPAGTEVIVQIPIN